MINSILTSFRPTLIIMRLIFTPINDNVQEDSSMIIQQLSYSNIDCSSIISHYDFPWQPIYWNSKLLYH